VTVTRDRAAELAALLEHARGHLRDAVDTRTRIAVDSTDRTLPESWRAGMALELAVADLRVDLWRTRAADLARATGVPL
jgi:hypothetical protein